MTDAPAPAPAPDAAPPAPVAAPAPAAAPAEPQGRYVAADRFEAVVAQKYDAIRQAEEAKARAIELERQLQEVQARSAPAAQPPGAPVPPVAPQPAFSAADINRLAEQKAVQLEFNKRCNEAALEGRKSFPDFDAKLTALKSVAPMRDANGEPMLPQHMIEAALETGKAAEVLYALGNDPSEADRIMSLSPMRQAVELARFADRLGGDGGEGGGVSPQSSAALAAAADRVVSSAPKPITQRVGVGRTATPAELPLDSPDLPIEEFMRRRDADVSRRASSGMFKARA